MVPASGRICSTKMKLLGVLFVIGTIYFVPSSGALCDRNPPYSMKPPMSGDNGFEIRLRDALTGRMADRFEPNGVYDVSLVNRFISVMFRDFYLVAVQEGAVDEMEGIGEFVHRADYPLTVDVRGCPGMVKSRRGHKQHVVLIQWRAPAKPSKCVEFRATVIKSFDVYYKNSGGLTKKFCPSVMFMMNEVKQKSGAAPELRQMPPMIKSCCACGTATYNLTFTGMWTKKYHPRHWPTQSGLVHWTNIIGASHSDKYLIYYPGGMASQGVQSICAYGDTTVLQQEFSAKAADHLRNLVKTRGIWGEENMADSRSVLFSVNRTHHLLSFITMLGPSPDWCSGLSAQDLCLPQCTWTDQIIVDLYPWDAGIKQGDTYSPPTSDRQDIPDPIRVITSDWLPGNPFTPNQPVARATIKRVKPMYNWECTNDVSPGVMDAKFGEDSENSGDLGGTEMLKKRRKSKPASPLSDPALAQMATFLCLTSEWSSWTPCSVTCGVGSNSRARVLEVNKKNELCRHIPLVEKQVCEGRKRTCDFSAKCSFLSWSEWSPCNATCQQAGVTWRTRTYARAEDAASCRGSENTKEMKECTKSVSDCDPVGICGEGLVEGLPCGTGEMRYYYSAISNDCKSFFYKGCKGSRNRFRTKEECENLCLPAVAQLPQWRREKMAMLQHKSSIQSSHKSGKDKLGKSNSADKNCMQPMDQGNKCTPGDKRIQIRWYFSSRTHRCREFFYQGCGGNSNNFLSYTMCTKACMADTMVEGMPAGPVQDCLMTDWGHWSPCSQLCGGFRRRWRGILKPAMNGGQPCGVLYEEAACPTAGPTCRDEMMNEFN